MCMKIQDFSDILTQQMSAYFSDFNFLRSFLGSALPVIYAIPSSAFMVYDAPAIRITTHTKLSLLSIHQTHFKNTLNNKTKRLANLLV